MKWIEERIECLTKWIGYEEKTWEPENLIIENARHKVLVFEKKEMEKYKTISSVKDFAADRPCPRFRPQPQDIAYQRALSIRDCVIVIPKEKETLHFMWSEIDGGKSSDECCSVMNNVFERIKKKNKECK